METLSKEYKWDCELVIRANNSIIVVPYGSHKYATRNIDPVIVKMDGWIRTGHHRGEGEFSMIVLPTVHQEENTIVGTCFYKLDDDKEIRTRCDVVITATRKAADKIIGIIRTKFPSIDVKIYDKIDYSTIKDRLMVTCEGGIFYARQDEKVAVKPDNFRSVAHEGTVWIVFRRSDPTGYNKLMHDFYKFAGDPDYIPLGDFEIHSLSALGANNSNLFDKVIDIAERNYTDKETDNEDGIGQHNAKRIKTVHHSESILPESDFTSEEVDGLLGTKLSDLLSYDPIEALFNAVSGNV